MGRLQRLWGVAWVPVYDPPHRLAEAERFWVWGATETHLMAYHCITHGDNEGNNVNPNSNNGEGGGERFPPANDELPPVERVAVCLPLLRTAQSSGGGDKAMLARETYLRQYFKVQEFKLTKATAYDETVAGMDATIDKELLVQCNAATADRKSSRAVDIASMFQLAATVDAAARFANDRQDRVVTEKLLALLAARKKLKKRRLCTLPFAKEVSDKDRDRLLKALLDAERAGISIGAAVAAPAAVAPQQHQTTLLSATPQRGAKQAATTNLLASPPASLGGVPPPSTTAVADAVKRSTTPQKRVVFDDDDVGTTTHYDDPAPAVAVVGVW